MQLALRAALGSRLIVWVVGLTVIAIFSANFSAIATNDPGFVTQPFHAVALNKLVAPAARWDSAWYIAIAQHGYYSAQSSNFFPLYPLLMSGVALVVGSPLIAGMLISLVSMLVGLTLLYRLALLDLDEGAASLTVLLVALFPVSLFLSAVYTESLFLMLSVSAVYAARRERWALAGVCGGLAAAAHSNGVIVLLPLVLLYLYGPRSAVPTRVAGAWWKPRFGVARSAAWLLLVPAGVLAYMGYLAATHGAPLAPFQAAQTYWGHSFRRTLRLGGVRAREASERCAWARDGERAPDRPRRSAQLERPRSHQSRLSRAGGGGGESPAGDGFPSRTSAMRSRCWRSRRAFPACASRCRASRATSW